MTSSLLLRILLPPSSSRPLAPLLLPSSFLTPLAPLLLVRQLLSSVALRFFGAPAVFVALAGGEQPPQVPALRYQLEQLQSSPAPRCAVLPTNQRFSAHSASPARSVPPHGLRGFSPRAYPHRVS